MTVDRKTHWDTVYDQKSEAQLSWHQAEAKLSLELIAMAGVTAASSVIDIGGGTSRLAAALLSMGLRDVTVLDLSQVALNTARDQLGQPGQSVTWIPADITSWTPDRQYDLWHDRAVFHFLVDAPERAAYLDSLARGLGNGGHAIIATFAPDGPETCSGFPVARYSPTDLAEVLGEGFELVAHRPHLHQTPWGKTQSFQFSLFRRTC
ncbi:class I SAM-dependent methyltransferase [Puniceibacterium sediminis]|uniref:Methyltransferase domain-containing protein n=1 Tax=Puniceibacterium sediminis TaxID=1608407 RepID=A0A238XPF5_9RHOB|nr:class I SAM-dependent methyltransferase [Puniceibacterium sediminis]SNR60468.1 Methyltransferase domain-containing protein [Puniceibacterium sediminis]